jgi:capsular exopolysaccharide synthesis family protein
MSAAGPVASPHLLAPPVEEANEGQESLLQLALDFVALVRRRILLVLCVTLATVAAVGIKLYFEQPLYRATAVIRLSNERRALSGGIATDPTDRLGMGTIDPLLSQIQVLRSRATAKEVVTREGLRLRPRAREFPTGVIGDVQVRREAPRGILRLTFSNSGVQAQGARGTVSAPYGMPVEIDEVRFTTRVHPGVPSAELAIISEDAAISALLKNLRGRPRDKTDVIDVDYTAADPQVAQRVVNSAVEVFKALNARTAQQQSTRRRRFVDEQLQKSEGSLAEAQAALNAFRTREQVYSSQDKIRSQQTELSGLEVRRQELDADRGIYQSLLNALERPRTGGSGERLSALVASPGIAQNPVVAQLYAQLVQYQAARDSLTTGTWASSADHPDVRRLDTLISSTEARVLAAVRGQISSIEARLTALDRLKTRSASEMTTLPRAEGEEAKLVQQADSYRRAAERLREELQKAQIEEAVEAGHVEIVDLAALPTLPIGTSRQTKLMLALALGLLLGAGAAYLFENRNAVIRRREGLEETLHVPNLGLIPRVRALPLTPARRLLVRSTGNGSAAATSPLTELVTLSEARSTGAEAYRTLRTNLLFSAAIQSLKTLVVTSAGPGDGKTTTACNLAVAFAQQGFRVALVDCDLRRARVHKVFQMSSRPGLTEAMLGSVELADVMKNGAVDNLYVLVAGTLPPNPSELVGSSHMRAMLERLSKTFDMVILDTPPLLMASDGVILSRMADGVLVVLRAGLTERGAAREAVQRLASTGARVLGTVLNDPDAEVAKYTGAYYGYYYSDYAEGKA